MPVFLVRIICLPVKLVLSFCSLIAQCSTYLYEEMSCFETENEGVREWKAQINQRNVLNTRLKNAVKKHITRGGSSHVNLIAQENLVEVLREQDRLHRHLISNCKLLLPENIVTHTFHSEIIKKENNFLLQEIEKLKKEKQRQKQHYEETIKLNNQRHREERQRDGQEIAELSSYCKFLKSQQPYLNSSSSGPDPNIINHIESLKTDAISKQRLFEETLQARNSTIEDLNRQLSKEKKKHENLLEQYSFKQANQHVDNIQFENENRRSQDYRDQMFQFQKKYQDLLELNNFYENENAALEIRLVRLEQQLQNRNEENNQLQDQLHDLRKEIEILISINDQYRRNDTAAITNSDYKIQTNQDYEQRILQIEQKYLNEVSALKSNSFQLEQDLQNKHKDICYLKSQLDSRRKEIEYLQLQNKSAQELIKEGNEKQKMYQEFEQQALQVREMNFTLVNLKDNYENKISTLNKALTSYEEQLKNMRQHNLKLQDAVTEYENQLSSYKLQNKISYQQLNEKDGVIERQNKEIQGLRENFRPTATPRKNSSNLIETEENNTEAPVSESQTETDDPYVQESLKKIESVYENTLNLQKQVEDFSGTNKEDKDFCHLQELLIRNIVKLDNVETEGHLVIREQRRVAIRLVQKVIDMLKGKVT